MSAQDKDSIYNNDDENEEEGLDTDLSPDYVEVASGKRPRKEEIHWNEPKEYVLVCTYRATKAFMKTKGGLNMEQKKLVAFNKFKLHGEFHSDAHLLSVNGIHAKYQRMERSLIAKYALDGHTKCSFSIIQLFLRGFLNIT